MLGWVVVLFFVIGGDCCAFLCSVFLWLSGFVLVGFCGWSTIGCREIRRSITVPVCIVGMDLFLNGCFAWAFLGMF